MKMEISVVDAFASRPFSGNPAAVCVLPAYPEDRLMQQIAMEMNLSETAFLVKQAPFDYRLRWFTPTTEVTLCGHATLAATHVLRQSGALGIGGWVTYRTLSGDLRARVLKEGIELDFPALPGLPAPPHPALGALGVEILACERNRDSYLVEVRDHAAILACSPDFKALAAMDLQGVIVTTATGTGEFDFTSRYFGPACGIDEDPVTGSAHCLLAPYWAKQSGKSAFRAFQASRRGGVLEVRMEKERILITGKAVITLQGQLQITPELKENAA